MAGKTTKRFDKEDLMRFIDDAVEHDPKCEAILNTVKYRVSLLSDVKERRKKRQK